MKENKVSPGFLAELRRISRRNSREALDKKEAEQRHALQRIHKRYGFKLSRKQLRSLIHQIQGGSARFIERESNNRSKFVVQHEGEELLVVYDKKRKMIVTALPTENKG